MQLEVRLFAVFRQGRFNRKAMDLPDGSSLRDLVGQLAIPEKEVSLPLVNGQYSPLERVLVAGDIVALFPAVGGG
jgi:molybdopterin converting factor small subunit